MRRLHVATVTVSCAGPEDGTIRSGPAGQRRSKDGASLEFTRADGEFWYGGYSKAAQVSAGLEHHVHLVEPSIAELEGALKDADDFLSQFVGAQDWRGGGIAFVYSGHGAPDTGALVLRDGEYSGVMLAEIVSSGQIGKEHVRHLDFILDSCFAGAFLADLLVAAGRLGTIRLHDARLASLPDEYAWEIPSLGHGALTFAVKNPGNMHVDRGKLAEAVDSDDQEYLRLALQGFVPNPVVYLTEGDQHPIRVTNGHLTEVEGKGHFELLDDPSSVDQILNALERAIEAGFEVEVPFEP